MAPGHLCTRTTLDIEDALLRLARRKAAGDGRTLTALIEDALRRLLGRPAPPRRRLHLRLPSRRGTGLPDVEIADREALYERLDGRR